MNREKSRDVKRNGENGERILFVDFANFFHVKISLARLLSEKCSQKALQSVIGRYGRIET